MASNLQDPTSNGLQPNCDGLQADKGTPNREEVAQRRQRRRPVTRVRPVTRPHRLVSG